MLTAAHTPVTPDFVEERSAGLGSTGKERSNLYGSNLNVVPIYIVLWATPTPVMSFVSMLVNSI